MQFQVVNVEGFTLTYDSDDVETVEFSMPHDVVDVSPVDATAPRWALGDAHLYLHVKFKPGAKPRWIEGK